jgi:RNA polymerase sigma-70 factor (ECF subfamily)
MPPANSAARLPVDPAAAFAEHHAFIRGRLRGLGVAEADLDDAAQDVFEVLVRRIADYDEQYAVRGWMAGMARRVARRYRERGKRAVVPIDEERVVASEGPEEQLARGEAWRVLREFLDELDPDRWAVFVLSEVEGLRGSEIAAELGVNQNTVYARLRSARTAFGRKLRRHHAREQRSVWALLPTWLGGSSRRAWVAPVVATATLAFVLGVGFTMGRCGGDPAERRPTADSPPPETAAASRELGVSERAVDPTPTVPVEDGAALSERQGPDEDGWYSAGSGFSSRGNVDGETRIVSAESRYRLDEDRMILEITYIGDDDVDVDDVRGSLELDGFELVDGSLEWAVSVPSEKTRVVKTTVRAIRPGRVRVVMIRGAKDGNLWSTRTVVLFNESGRLRLCDGDECETPVAEEAEALSGQTITVNVLNECQVPKQFVLYAGYPDRHPPPDTRVHMLEPGEKKRMKIDAAQWFLHRQPDGKVGGGVHTDSDGGWVRFFGSGDECNGVSTADADFEQPPME